MRKLTDTERQTLSAIFETELRNKRNPLIIALLICCPFDLFVVVWILRDNFTRGLPYAAILAVPMSFFVLAAILRYRKTAKDMRAMLPAAVAIPVRIDGHTTIADMKNTRRVHMVWTTLCEAVYPDPGKSFRESFFVGHSQQKPTYPQEGSLQVVLTFPGEMQKPDSPWRYFA